MVWHRTRTSASVNAGDRLECGSMARASGVKEYLVVNYTVVSRVHKLIGMGGWASFSSSAITNHTSWRRSNTTYNKLLRPGSPPWEAGPAPNFDVLEDTVTSTHNSTSTRATASFSFCSIVATAASSTHSDVIMTRCDASPRHPCGGGGGLPPACAACFPTIRLGAFPHNAIKLLPHHAACVTVVVMKG